MSLLSRLPRPSGWSASSAAVRLVVVACGLALAAVWLVPSTALAAPIHVFSTTFGASGSGAGQMSSPQGVAVNDATGDVYVADTGNRRVDEFDSSGKFVRAWGWGVADGASSFETCTTTCQAGINGSGAGQFESPTFIAVDNSTGASAGDVYVGDTGENLVTKFDASGNLVSSWGNASPSNGQLSGANAPNGPFGPLAGVAVDTSGSVWVYDQNSNMFEFAQDGSFTTDWNSGRGVDATGIAVDGEGNLYVVVGAGSLEQFGASGTDLGEVTDDQTGSPITGSAIDTTTNDIYADDGGGLIRHYDGSALSTCVPAGNCVAEETFGSGSLSGSAAGVAYDPVTGGVLVADAGNNDVAVFAPPTGPLISSEYVTNVGSDDAHLDAQINPVGADTTYQFQYGTSGPCSSKPCAAIPVSPADIGAGSGVVTVSAALTGLTPGTTYNYRVVATNSLGTTDGPDRSLSTYPAPAPPQSCPNAQVRIGYSASLPDCRAYEMVSPVDKNGGDVALPSEGLVGGVQASVTGTSMAYRSGTPFAGSQATAAGSFYLASRGANGWSTQSLLPPQATNSLLGIGPAIVGFSPDLSLAAFQDGANYGQDDPPLVAGEPTGVANLFIRNDTTDSYQLVDVTPAGDRPGNSLFVGASSDYSHVVFESYGQLTADLPLGQSEIQNLYEWSDGTVRLVNLIPPAGDTECGGAGPACIASSNGGDAGGGGFFGGALNAVSADGSKIYFIDSGNQDNGQLYVRENGTTTVEVSASQKTNGSGPGGTDPNGPIQPLYQTASADGSKVFFTSCEQLTNDSTAVSNGPGSCAMVGTGTVGSDLYEYDTTTGKLTDLTVDPSPITDPSCSSAAGTFCGANVQGVLGVSSDGSYVYFVANGVLAAGASPGTCDQNQTPGETCNLYVSHNGAITYIGALGIGDQNDWTPPSSGLTARVSPDGAYLTFMSTRSLTGYDNTDLSTGQPDSEVFLYNATSNRLVCASCNPTGERPLGPSSISDRERSAILALYLPRNLSDDGRLFFDSSDALVPAATNGVQDVYEWEPEGLGSCQSAAANGGCLYLISSGTSPEDSTFLDATPSGDDVFFATSQQLVSQDTDQNVDIYDARVDGGIAAQNPPPPQAPCTADTCTGPATAAPPIPTAASIAFSGPGDQTSPSPSKTKLSRVKVTNKAVNGSQFILSVKVPAKGRITITGADVTKATKAVVKTGTYRLTLTLTTKAKRALKKKRRLRLAIKAAYKPSSGNASAVSVSIEMKA